MTDTETLAGRLRRVLRERLGIDPRSLAAFRIIVGLTVVVDVGMRLRDLRAFYTNAGVLPTDALAELYPALARLSVHAVSGSPLFQVFLFALTLLLALALAVGYRTRATTIALLVMYGSCLARNPYVVNGGDTMLLALLLFGAFLPLGRRWSIDAIGDGATTTDGPEERVLSVATAAVLVYLVTIYTTNAVLRYRSEEWMSGEAVVQVFALESFTVYLGPYLAETPDLLVAINWLWVGMLTVSALLVVLTGWGRVVLVGGFVTAHLGMLLTLRLGTFPVVVISALALFLPPVFWDAVAPRARRIDAPRPDMYLSSPRRVIPRRPREALSRLSPVAASVVLVVYILWQATSLGYVGASATEDWSVSPGEYGWKMFSPTPPDEDGWYVSSVTYEDGDTSDPLNGGTVSYDRPPDLADAYPTSLWHRYLSDMRYATDAELGYLARYLCRRASAEGHPERIVVRYLEEPVDVDRGALRHDRRERITLTERDCVGYKSPGL